MNRLQLFVPGVIEVIEHIRGKLKRSKRCEVFHREIINLNAALRIASKVLGSVGKGAPFVTFEENTADANFILEHLNYIDFRRDLGILIIPDTLADTLVRDAAECALFNLDIKLIVAQSPVCFDFYKLKLEYSMPGGNIESDEWKCTSARRMVEFAKMSSWEDNFESATLTAWRDDQRIGTIWRFTDSVTETAHIAATYNDLQIAVDFGKRAHTVYAIDAAVDEMLDRDSAKEGDDA